MRGRSQFESTTRLWTLTLRKMQRQERRERGGRDGDKGVRKIYHNRKDGQREREKEERGERMRKRDHIFDILTEKASASKTQWE